MLHTTEELRGYAKLLDGVRSTMQKGSFNHECLSVLDEYKGFSFSRGDSFNLEPDFTGICFSGADALSSIIGAYCELGSAAGSDIHIVMAIKEKNAHNVYFWRYVNTLKYIRVRCARELYVCGGKKYVILVYEEADEAAVPVAK